MLFKANFMVIELITVLTWLAYLQRHQNYRKRYTHFCVYLIDTLLPWRSPFSLLWTSCVFPIIPLGSNRVTDDQHVFHTWSHLIMKDSPSLAINHSCFRQLKHHSLIDHDGSEAPHWQFRLYQSRDSQLRFHVIVLSHKTRKWVKKTSKSMIISPTVHIFTCSD